MSQNFEKKYFKYKQKYLNLVNQFGGAAVKAIQMIKTNDLTEKYNKIYMKKREGSVYISGTISFGSKKLNFHKPNIMG